jgi:hypothetical protein
MTELDLASGGETGVPTGSEDPPSKRRLTPKRLIIVFVACSLGVLCGTLVANALNGSSDSSAMGTWFASYGANYSQVSHDVAKITIDSNAANVNLQTVRADCERLATDVATGQDSAPMPNGTLEPTWSGILAQLKNAAQKCSSGIDQRNSTELSQAGEDMSNAGTKYLQLLKEVNALK